MGNRKNALVSIVSPIYNGEKYIDRMVQSVLDQTYRNIELLLIDDFSNDRSLEIIKGYEQSDNRVRVIPRTTKGGTAVKGQEFALSYCDGLYYFYLSQDDFIATDFIEKAVKKSEEEDAEVVIPNMYLYNDGEVSEKEGTYPIGGNYFQTISAKEGFLLSLDWKINGFPFRRMELVKKVGIRAEFYNSCEFYVRKSYLYANKIAFCDGDFYYRQDNPAAITKGFHYFHIDILTTDIMLLELLQSNHYDKKVVSNRYKELKRSLISWIKTGLRTPVSSIYERIYMLKALILAGAKMLDIRVKLIRREK